MIFNQCKVAVLITSLATLVGTTASAQNSGLFTEASLGGDALCYSIRRSSDTGLGQFSSGGQANAYASIARSRAADLVCIGDEVVITRPVYTNGGNVMILANKLRILAPIDTRVYFQISDPSRQWRDREPYAGISAN